MTKGMPGMGSDAKRDAFFRKVLRLLLRADIPFLVGGGYAFAAYTKIRRDTKDLDLFIKPDDCESAIAMAREAGFETWVKSPHWLGKIQQGEHFVDLIYSSGNGACPVDDAWFSHAVPTTLLGLKLRLIPTEEMIWSKAFIMERHRYDGADIAHLLLARGPAINWERLLDRFDAQWPVLLSHLLLFRFIYPQSASQIPDRVLAALVARISETQTPPRRKDEPLCRGTLLSFCEYLPDVEAWGYRDARLWPLGALTRPEIDRWTAEPK